MKEVKVANLQEYYGAERNNQKQKIEKAGKQKE